MTVDNLPVRPSIHVLAYGDPGAGKSTFASTFPTPMLVLMWDPFGKEIPYLKRGRPTELYAGDHGQQCRSVYAPTEDVEIIRVEYYHETEFVEPTFRAYGKAKDHIRVAALRPVAYKRFLARIATIHREYDTWKTLVCDSVTFMELAARNWSRYELNPHVEDPRQWYAESKEFLEGMLMVRFGGLPMNVVVIAHIDEEKDEINQTFLRNPAAPGKLRKQSPAGFGEVYHSVVRFDQGERVYMLQTRPDRMFNAETHIEASDPCWPDYNALWENYR